MTNPILSNSVENKQVVLWQYDHAPNLIGIIDGFNQIASDTVTQFWDYFRDSVFDIETADYFGLNVLGRMMGLPRPKVEMDDGSDSDSEADVKQISDDFYRRLLKGRFFLFGMSPTVPNYNKYLSIIWGRLPMSCFPIRYWGGAAPSAQSDSSDSADPSTVIADPCSLAFIERTETYPDGSDSDSKEDTAKFLDVYDARSNTFLFTMSESSEGVYAYASSNPELTITFNGSAPTSEIETVSRAKVIDGGALTVSTPGPMAMEFTTPVYGATEEELAMHRQHPDLIYFYPAGIRTNEPSASSTMVIGTENQNLENFADAFSWVENPTTAGGILAGNEKAKFLDGLTEDGNEGGDGNG